MHLEDPQFPPLLKGHAVKAPTRPFAHACRLAKSRQLGAGDAVWSRNTARAELAIVLEPEVPLERALQMAPLMMVALGDCIGSLSPPKVAIHYRWPNGILLNGSMAGEVRLGAPNVAAGAIPDWLVVGAELGIASPREERQNWSRTSLSEEAGPEITRTDVLRSLAAHFLTWLNTWQDEGFRPVHDQWLFRAEGREARVAIVHGRASIEGQALGLDESANLLLKTASGEVRSLAYLDSVDLIDARPRELMKLLKTIRFDASDERVFELAAMPEEWAVSGAFAFAGLGADAIAGKTRQAFANGFLGLLSFGRSTFAAVAEATRLDLEEIERRLAEHFVSAHAAPGLEAALPAAREEAAFVVDLCRDAAVNTVFTVRRTWDARGQIKEEFRTIRPSTGEPLHAKIWTVVDDEA